VLNSARLIFDLQRVNKVIQNISGCLDPERVAREITEALVREFNCAFTRIWLTEPDQQSLCLVASSGLYERIDGDFARVAMGAYKVGKIAKNAIPFLSNHLAEESWVKDKNWAIANGIHGFAGYPLIRQDRVIGVLAAFSREAFLPEFLEVLQVLCMAGAIAIESAQQIQQQTTTVPSPARLGMSTSLSDQLSNLLTTTNLTLVGTEQALSTSYSHVLLQTVEMLNRFACSYCRLTYGDREIALASIITMPSLNSQQVQAWWRSHFGEIEFLCDHLNGSIKAEFSLDERVTEISLTLPYPHCKLNSGDRLNLSQRETEVLAGLARGLRDKAIAQELFISESTVKFHINGMLTKLKAKNRYQAIYQATLQGLI
jgi:DNA-binding CsgD family transcriptional regulator